MHTFPYNIVLYFHYCETYEQFHLAFPVRWTLYQINPDIKYKTRWTDEIQPIRDIRLTQKAQERELASRFKNNQQQIGDWQTVIVKRSIVENTFAFESAHHVLVK